MNHHDISAFLLHIAVVLLVARFLGEVSRKFGQPAVIGELIAGIILGKSVFGALGITFFYDLPEGVKGPLQTISLLGVLLLLLLTGLETDFSLIRRNARSALAVSVGGLLLPLASGAVFGMLVPERFIPATPAGALFPAFMAVCMGISALPVIGKVLIELKITRLGISQTLIASAMLEDATGWLILSVILALLSGAQLSMQTVGYSLLVVLGFIFVSFTLGRWLLKQSFEFVQNKIPGPEASISLIFIATFIVGACSQYFGLEAIFGAFIVGILLSLLRKSNDQSVHSLHLVTLNIFAPLFFGFSGLNVDILSAFKNGAHWLTLSIILVAVFSKLIGGYIGGRYFAKQSKLTALFFGIGLNARGSMEVIVATIGLRAGVLTPEVFSAIVLMAIVTSLMAPPGLRWVVSKLDLSKEERERLAREELRKGSLTGNLRKVLIPIRLRSTPKEVSPIHALEAFIMERLDDGEDITLTLFTIITPGQEAKAHRYLDLISPLFPKVKLLKKVVVSSTPGDAILDEAVKGYDLIILGTPTPQHGSVHGGGSIFTSLIDHVTHRAPCPVILLQSTKPLLLPTKGARIVVPTNGSSASQNAADFAFKLASYNEAEVHLLKVIDVSHGLSSSLSIQRQRVFSQEHTAHLQKVANLMGAVAVSTIEEHEEPEKVIIDRALQLNAHLLVIGTGSRPGAEKLFLGPRVERILAHAPCPVMIVSS